MTRTSVVAAKLAAIVCASYDDTHGSATALGAAQKTGIKTKATTMLSNALPLFLLAFILDRGVLQSDGL